jgi:hypothetical protein
MIANDDEANERADFFETASRYWATQPSEKPELLGVPASGGGGPIEALYRQYEELRHFQRIISIDKSKSLLEREWSVGDSTSSTIRVLRGC